MILDRIASVNSFLATRRGAATDTKVFRLHTILTPAIFMTCSIFYGMKELVGEPLACVGSKSVVTNIDQVATLYCWVSSTYSVHRHFERLPNKLYPIHPGVGPLQSHKDTTTHHKYYIWIPLYFFFLSVLFYAPRYLWKDYEGGRMRMLVEKLDNPVLSENDKRERVQLLCNYIKGNMGFNSFYAGIFFACEILAFGITVFSFYLTDLLIKHKFATYGWDVAHYLFVLDRKEQKNRFNPMDIVFPKVAKCEFPYFGPGGNIQPNEYLCTLALNNFNDKIFFGMWFYLILLGIISILSIIFRLAQIFSSRVRSTMLKLSLMTLRKSPADRLKNLSVGDWFLINQIGKNVERLIFWDFLDKLAAIIHDDEGQEDSNEIEDNGAAV